MITPEQDPYTAEDFRHFSDKDIRAYLAGHRSLFTVAELEILDEAWENRFNDNIYNIRIRYSCKFLNTTNNPSTETTYTIPQVALRSRQIISRRISSIQAG